MPRFGLSDAYGMKLGGLEALRVGNHSITASLFDTAITGTGSLVGGAIGATLLGGVSDGIGVAPGYIAGSTVGGTAAGALGTYVADWIDGEPAKAGDLAKGAAIGFAGSL